MLAHVLQPRHRVLLLHQDAQLAALRGAPVEHARAARRAPLPPVLAAHLVKLGARVRVRVGVRVRDRVGGRVRVRVRVGVRVEVRVEVRVYILCLSEGLDPNAM